MLRQPHAPNLWLTNAQWTLFLVLVGIMSGYARRVLGEATTSHTLAMTRVEHLADANRLLSSLHTVAQVLPASLDLDEVLDSTMVRLRELFGYDAAALLLLDETDGSWRVSRWDGHRLPNALQPLGPADRVATGPGGARGAHGAEPHRARWRVWHPR